MTTPKSTAPRGSAPAADMLDILDSRLAGIDEKQAMHSILAALRDYILQKQRDRDAE